MAKDVLNLTDTIKVNDQEYNVNAVTAQKVAKPLILSKKDINNNSTLVQYNGSIERTVNIVPAEGGRFNGPIRVPNQEPDKPIANEAVLNYSDLTTKILQNFLNNSTSYNYDGENFPPSSSTGEEMNGVVNGISIIHGKEEDVETFANANYDAYHENADIWISTFIYVCSDDPFNIYFGDCAHTDALRIAKSAERLDTAHSVLVDLTSENPAEFDGTPDTDEETKTLSPGVSGTLSIEHGGTGKNNLEAFLPDLMRHRIIKDKNGKEKTISICKEALGDETTNDTVVKDGAIIKPEKIIVGNSRIKLPSGNSGKLLDGFVYNTCGINMNNSDIVNINGLWFADSVSGRGEGLIFARDEVIDKNGQKVADPQNYVDRLAAHNGNLYFSIAEKFYDNGKMPEDSGATVGTVFHSKMASPIPVANGGTGKDNLAEVTVGTADTATTADTIKILYATEKTGNAVNTNYKNATIRVWGATKVGLPVNSVGADGDIVILFDDE